MLFDVFNFVYLLCLEILEQKLGMYISFVSFGFDIYIYIIYIYYDIRYYDMYYLGYIQDIERDRNFAKLYRVPTILFR